MIYTPELIREIAPSVFATSPSEKMSNRYVFVPTVDILENFEKQGWNVSSVKQIGKGIHSVHELRFRNSELPKVGDSLIEAVIRNSHNGMATFSVGAGLHRLVCENGLTVPTAVSESFNIKHQRFDLDDAKKLTETFASRLPIIQNSVDKMRSKILTTDEKDEFIVRACNLRWKKGLQPKKIDVLSIIQPRRKEDDNNDMWTTFNVVQENFVKGGLKYTSNSGKQTQLRGLKNIITVSELNTKLWELAEEMC